MAAAHHRNPNAHRRRQSVNTHTNAAGGITDPEVAAAASFSADFESTSSSAGGGSTSATPRASYHYPARNLGGSQDPIPLPQRRSPVMMTASPKGFTFKGSGGGYGALGNASGTPGTPVSNNGGGIASGSVTPTTSEPNSPKRSAAGGYYRPGAESNPELASTSSIRDSLDSLAGQAGIMQPLHDANGSAPHQYHHRFSTGSLRSRRSSGVRNEVGRSFNSGGGSSLKPYHSDGAISGTDDAEGEGAQEDDGAAETEIPSTHGDDQDGAQEGENEGGRKSVLSLEYLHGVPEEAVELEEDLREEDANFSALPPPFQYETLADYLAKSTPASAPPLTPTSLSGSIDSESGKAGGARGNGAGGRRSFRDPLRKRLYYGNPECPPRFMFYSEVTGLLRADHFQGLDFSGFDRPVKDLLKAGPFWLDVCAPSPVEMQTLTSVFGIHPLTSEDIMTEDTREKCEIFRNYYFITIRTFDSDQYSNTYMQPINMYIIIFRECVLSFHAQHLTHPLNVLRRIDQLRTYGLRISPDWLNYALIDDITDGFMPVLRFIELEVDSIDDLVLILRESEQSDMLRRIGHARKKVMSLMRLLITKADVIKAVIKRCGEKLAPGSDTTLYLGDIQDHVITMVQNLNHFERILTNAHSNYLAQISIEITQSSNRTSVVVMRMTALASILIPLNVITGLWGMNVRVPGQDDDTLMWFCVIVTCMGFIALVSYSIVRRWKLV
ncbi:CorA metal ion transporter [Irineochytrium annulatum]|nr:CorA metal ion transporter [Irineochytrium annulatum]